MSEFFENNRKKTDSLLEFARGLMNRSDVSLLIQVHKEAIDSVTPSQAMQVLDCLIAEGFSVPDVKANVAKILNVFFLSLNSFVWEKPEPGHFLHYLMLENREAEKKMQELRKSTKQFFNGKGEKNQDLAQEMKLIISGLKGYDLHYQKKENILFPFIEKSFSFPGCLKIMWLMHDDFRQTIRDLETLLSVFPVEKEKLNKAFGKLFFTVLPVIFREEHIVYPAVYNAIHQRDWDSMLKLSSEAGWYHISPSIKSFEETKQISSISGLADLGTGSLSISQIIQIFNTLPVDITFVDENDEVRYFSDTRHKIFGRSKAIIGRKVQNCHPHDSVEIVNQILKAFREGRKDHADFWITIHTRFIHIRYFALHDATGAYKGTIEVTQDVTGIRSLEGERRLLDWKD